MRKIYLLLIALILSSCSLFEDSNAYLDRKEKLTTLHELWSKDLGKSEYSSGLITPKLDHGVVYSATTDGTVISINAANGQTIWQKKLAANLVSGPSLGTRLVLVSDDSGNIFALKKEDGSIAWKYKAKARVDGNFLSYNNNFYAQVSNGTILALNNKGEKLWTNFVSDNTFTIKGNSTPFIYNNELLVATDNETLVAFGLNGSFLWSIDLKDSAQSIVDIDLDPLVDGKVGYLSSHANRFVALNLNNQSILWDKSIAATGIDVVGNLLLVSSKNKVYALNKIDGSALWHLDRLEKLTLVSSKVFKDIIVATDNNGYIHLISFQTGQLVGQIRPNKDGFSQGISIENDYLAVQSLNNVIYVYKR